MIVTQLENKVETEHSVEPVIPTTGPAIIKASAESILAEEEDDVFTTSLISGKPLMWRELKEHVSYRALMESDGHKLQTCGQRAKCCCPFHTDRNPSFVINEEDDYARCYGCNWHGNIFKYEQEFHGIEFKEAWQRINAFVRNFPRTGRKAKSIRKKIVHDEPQFTPRQLAERKLYAERLATEDWLANLLCERRFLKTGEKWNPAIIRQLAEERSLGWAGGAVAFIYPRGTKYRDWPHKEFYWEADGTSLWRGERLAGAGHIYLTESETDAITLLHAGIEEEEKNSAVIAVSGARNFQAAWAEQFRGKIVTLCFDDDEAGKNGALKTGLALRPYVTKLLNLGLGGVI